MQELASWCLKMLHTYSSWQQAESTTAPGTGDVHAPTPGKAAAAAEAERADQLKALLKLLASLTQSFDTDMSSRLAEVRSVAFRSVQRCIPCAPAAKPGQNPHP
jgi:hypothetical protein